MLQYLANDSATLYATSVPSAVVIVDRGLGALDKVDADENMTLENVV